MDTPSTHYHHALQVHQGLLTVSLTSESLKELQLTLEKIFPQVWAIQPGDTMVTTTSKLTALNPDGKVLTSWFSGCPLRLLVFLPGFTIHIPKKAPEDSTGIEMCHQRLRFPRFNILLLTWAPVLDPILYYRSHNISLVLLDYIYAFTYGNLDRPPPRNGYSD